MKPFMYHMNEWCEYIKKKIIAIRETNKLLPSYNLINIDGEIVWKNWR